MLTFLIAFLAAALLALALTPLVRRYALTAGAVSNPGGRNVNVRAIPRLGGVAIAVAAIVPVAVLFFLNSKVATTIQRQGLLASGLGFGAIVMGAVGARDDLKGMRAVLKLGAQGGCAIVAYYAGFQIRGISLPFIGVLEMGVFALPVTMLWIVGITNAVNLIDGLDGLAAGVVFCAAGTNLAIAILNDSVFVALIMASLMGSLIGFLFYNFNPAKIFMGDSGSYFLGFVLATVSLAGNQKASTAVSLLVPMLALGLPIFDTLFSIVRRSMQRRPIFSADRGHLHHRLLDMGLTHRRAVLVLYLMSLLFALSAVGVSIGKDWETGAALLGATILIGGLIGFIRVFDRVHAQGQSGHDDLVVALLNRLPSFVREWESTSSIQRANTQLARLVPLPDVDELCFVDRAHLPKRSNGCLYLSGTGGPWTLSLRSSAPISHEARALMRLIAQTAAGEETHRAARESQSRLASGEPEADITRTQS